MAAAAGNAPIIIKKVKKGGGGGHHGGAWKVAYADFVTAMMAFFLLLWLLNATTEEQKMGIADYFTPSSVSRSSSGGGGVLAGQSLSKSGVMTNNRSSVSVTMALPSPAEESDSEGDARVRKTGPSVDVEEVTVEVRSDDEGLPTPEQQAALEQAELEEMLAEREQAQFDEAEEQLRRSLESVPELAGLAENLLVDQTLEGLRIQIVDRDKAAMFPLGGARMYEHTEQLMGLVVQAVADLPNQLAIKGHTDATPFSARNGYGNWELSTDRAHASRRALLNQGLPEERIASVAGRAAQELLLPNDPFSAQNRRISIILLRENLTGEAAREAAAGTAEVGAPRQEIGGGGGVSLE